MDEGIADAIIQHCLDSHTGPPEVGEKRACVAEKADGVEENAEKKKKKTSDCLEKVPGKLKAKEATEETPGESMGGRSGQGPPMQCFYKGKHRTIHDGGGLCSPGRWPVDQRPEDPVVLNPSSFLFFAKETAT